MQKAFLFVETTARVVPEGDTVLRQLVEKILSHAVIVRAPTMAGGGVILADSIITSLFLVGAYTMVTVCFFRGQSMKAVVVGRDEENHLAKLKPLSC